MTATREEWLAAVNAVTYPDYAPQRKPAARVDLADQLAMLAGLEVPLRRFLEYMRAHGVPEDAWPALVALAQPDRAAHRYAIARADLDSNRAYTDLGLAERVADQHAAALAWCRGLGGWIGWDGTRWKTGDGEQVAQAAVVATVRRLKTEVVRAQQEEAAAEEGDPAKMAKAKATAVAKFANASQAAGRIAAAATLARSEGLAVDPNVFDQRAELLTARNGVLVLADTVRFREHRRSDRATLTTAVDYDPGAPSTRWDAFLQRVQPDADMRRYLQKLAGYSLLGTNERRLLVFLLGDTSTGKSTFVETIGAVLGDHAADFKLSLFVSKQDESARPDLLEALPKRFVHASETSSRWKIHGDEIKTLTGHDTQRARALHSSVYVSRKPGFTPWIASNAAPSITGADTALFRRLVVVPFDVVIPQDREQAGLSEQLVREEGPAILAWLGRGWELYKAEGLEPPVAAQKATAALRSDLSVLDTWLTEETESGDYSTSADGLWNAFTAWAKDARVPDADIGSKIAFGKGLTARGFGSTRTGPSNKRVRERTGLRLASGGGGADA